MFRDRGMSISLPLLGQERAACNGEGVVLCNPHDRAILVLSTQIACSRLPVRSAEIEVQRSTAHAFLADACVFELQVLFCGVVKAFLAARLVRRSLQIS